MTPSDYTRVIGHAHSVHQLARLIDLAKLDAAIAAIDTAESVGPVLDPTLFQETAAPRVEDREVLVAVRHLAHLRRVRERTAAS